MIAVEVKKAKVFFSINAALVESFDNVHGINVMLQYVMPQVI